VAEIPRFVVEASVVARWHLRDESYIVESDIVRDDFAAGRMDLVAPDILRYEVPSAILRATRNRSRTQLTTHQEGAQAVTDFLSWGILLQDSAAFVQDAFRLAGTFNCSYYDALYLVLADTLGCPVIHADEKLRRALDGRFPLSVG
jgi:predicted nucleic acid-binding protein